MISVAVISSRSTVIVPDLSGLTSSQALSALSAVELTVGSTSTTASGANSSNNGKVASQSVSVGTEVERYSSVNYVTYYYEAAPPPTCSPLSTTSGGTASGPIVDLSGNNTYCVQYYIDGITTTTASDCSTSTTTGVTYSVQVSCPGSGGGGGGGGGGQTCTPYYFSGCCRGNADCTGNTSCCSDFQ